MDQRTPLEQAARAYVIAYDEQRRKVINGQPVTTADRVRYERAQQAWLAAMKTTAGGPAEQGRAAA